MDKSRWTQTWSRLPERSWKRFWTRYQKRCRAFSRVSPWSSLSKTQARGLSRGRINTERKKKYGFVHSQSSGRNQGHWSLAHLGCAAPGASGHDHPHFYADQFYISG